MRERFVGAVLAVMLALPFGRADAAALRNVFDRVSGSVVVVGRIGDSDKVEVADQVFVIGAPYGTSEALAAPM
jgi:S1-C subfamily serine protease